MIYSFTAYNRQVDSLPRKAVLRQPLDKKTYNVLTVTMSSLQVILFDMSTKRESATGTVEWNFADTHGCLNFLLFYSGNSRTKIDCIHIRSHHSLTVIDCKAILYEATTPQHRLLIYIFQIKPPLKQRDSTLAHHQLNGGEFAGKKKKCSLARLPTRINWKCDPQTRSKRFINRDTCCCVSGKNGPLLTDCRQATDRSCEWFQQISNEKFAAPLELETCDIIPPFSKTKVEEAIKRMNVQITIRFGCYHILYYEDFWEPHLRHCSNSCEPAQFFKNHETTDAMDTTITHGKTL